MKKVLLLITVLLFGLGIFFTKSEPPFHFKDLDGRPYAETPSWHPAYKTTYTAPYVSWSLEPDLDTLQCPIPMECRVRNYTGVQCVWSSIECLGRWAEEPRLINPPLTSDRDCKNAAGPDSAAAKLKQLGVKFEQVTGRDRTAGIALIKKAMAEGRGCLWDVPGHAMVICNYSEEDNRVCYIDNSDVTLKVQTITIKRFMERWGGWVLVIYADNDVIPYKMFGANKIPIQDHANPNFITPDKYIPMPPRS